jgi:hypothetical protein
MTWTRRRLATVISWVVAVAWVALLQLGSAAEVAVRRVLRRWRSPNLGPSRRPRRSVPRAFLGSGKAAQDMDLNDNLDAVRTVLILRRRGGIRS